jgi:predicted acetyltransferase
VELVNPVPVEEARDWMAALVTTLLGSPYDDDFPRHVDRWARNWYPDRTWGYRDNGRWVATLATEPRTLTVPGPSASTLDIEVDALTGVTVAATHRRRGLLTSMITESLRAAKERGDALSILIAAEWPIYGRFGYAPAVTNAEFTYHPRRPNATLPAAPAGSLRQVEPAEVGKTAREIFDAARRLRPGQVDRPGPWWDRSLGLDGYEPIGKRPHWILHDGPDGPDGLLAWKITRDFDLSGRLGAISVDEFVAANDTAYRDLWSYLGAIDVIDEVKLNVRPLDEPVRWLLDDARTLEQSGAYDFLWIRLLDLPAALAARSYAVPGRVVLDVVDEGTGGYGAGRVVLEADDTGALCQPTTDAADLRITQRALAACYLGGYRMRQIAGAGSGVEELTPGALDRADVMFSVPLAPWNQTGF